MDDRTRRGYGTGARLFHWLTAVLVFVMIPAGVAMTSEGFEGVRDSLFILHKGLGSVLLGLVLLRLAWKALAPSPPPLPDVVPDRQRRLAELSHVGLYLLLVVMTVSGYARVRTGGFPIELLDAVGFPVFLPEMEGVSATLSVIHKVSAYALVALLAVHLAAAVYHAWIRRDGVFGRMWPPVA
jgi:cytochrome b561